MDNARRVLYRPEHVAALRGVLARAKADLHEMHFRHLCELADLRREVGELREALQLVMSITRQQVEADVASMRRQLELALARVERDPRKPLH